MNFREVGRLTLNKDATVVFSIDALRLHVTTACCVHTLEVVYEGCGSFGGGLENHDLLSGVDDYR